MRARSVLFSVLAVFSAAAAPADGGEPARFSARTERFAIPTREGRSVEAILRLPAKCPPGTRFAAVLVFGGFETAGRVLDLLEPEEPLILASFDYPYGGNRRLKTRDFVRNARELKRGVRDTEAAIGALVERLATRPDVDPARIAIIGASFGAPFALRAAAERPEVAAVVLVHGFGEVGRAARHRLTQIWSRRIGWLAKPAAWAASALALAYLDPPDPESDAARLRPTQAALMIEASEDTFIPPESRASLWEALAASPARTRRIRMPGDHIAPGATALIREVIRLTTGWLKESGWFATRPRCGAEDRRPE